MRRRVLLEVNAPHDEQRDLPGEHRGILEAVLARDAGQAGDRLTRHIERTSSVLLAVADRTSDPA